MVSLVLGVLIPVLAQFIGEAVHDGSVVLIQNTVAVAISQSRIVHGARKGSLDRIDDLAQYRQLGIIQTPYFSCVALSAACTWSGGIRFCLRYSTAASSAIR